MSADNGPRDAALAALVAAIPYAGFLGMGFESRGDELTGVLRYSEPLIGNPLVPALHGGGIAAFLEVTAVIQLGWSLIMERVEAGEVPDKPVLPKTIGVTVDYHRPGQPRDLFARARILRSGRRFASVQVEAWQDNRAKPVAVAMVHFLMAGQ